MNKPQYLAELGQLLIFMTRADREQTLERYGALFDAAGPDGQDALLAKLGSTTRQAIRLSRIYAAGGYEDKELDALEAGVETASGYEDEDEPAPEPGPAAIVEEDLPDFGQPDLPDLPDLPDEPVPEPAPSAAPTEPASENGEDDADYEELWGKRPAPPEKAAPAPAGDEPASEPEEKYEEEEDEQQPQPSPPPASPASRPSPSVTTAVERVIPLWAGIPLFVLTVIFIAVPLAAICLALVPVLLLPGLAVLLGAWLAFVGGLWCISIIADAAVLFGSALILLALGLIILWCGLWMDVAMVSGFIRGLRGLAHLTLGKKVTVHA